MLHAYYESIPMELSAFPQSNNEVIKHVTKVTVHREYNIAEIVKSDDAKKHLITVLIAVAVTIVLVLFFNLLLPLIVKAFIGPSISDPDGSMTGEDGKTMISALKMFIR